MPLSYTICHKSKARLKINKFVDAFCEVETDSCYKHMAEMDLTATQIN